MDPLEEACYGDRAKTRSTPCPIQLSLPLMVPKKRLRTTIVVILTPSRGIPGEHLPHPGCHGRIEALLIHPINRGPSTTGILLQLRGYIRDHLPPNPTALIPSLHLGPCRRVHPNRLPLGKLPYSKFPQCPLFLRLEIKRTSHPRLSNG